MAFQTSLPVAISGATGVTGLTKFVSSIGFQASSTGVSVSLYRDWIVQPGTGTPALVATGTGNVDAAVHKYWVRAHNYSNPTGFVDSAISSSVTNDGTHKQNTFVIPGQAVGVVSLDVYRIEGAGSVTGQLLTTIYASTHLTTSSGTPGNVSSNLPDTTITGQTITDNTATANLGATGSLTTGTTNTTGILVDTYFANALANGGESFGDRPLAGCPVWGIVLSGTGTILGSLRGR